MLLRTQAGRRPNVPALNLPGSPPRELTWGQLFREVEDLAAGLLASGVRAGHVALLLTAPGHRSVLVELSLRAIGAVPVRLGPGADDDVWALTDAERRSMGIEPLPQNLGEAIELAAIRARLEPLRATMSEEDFEELVADIARITLPPGAGSAG